MLIEAVPPLHHLSQILSFKAARCLRTSTNKNSGVFTLFLKPFTWDKQISIIFLLPQSAFDYDKNGVKSAVQFSPCINILPPNIAFNSFNSFKTFLVAR